MASTQPLTQESNLLMTLPPELRNEIYALVITSDSYELDPTISAKIFPRPRPRYGIFGCQRGIKAQGGPPAIAQTCQQIRAESLDVYYGRNTFALIGNETSTADKTQAMANRVNAHDWIHLIGDNAKYLRKVRILLALGEGACATFLVSVAADSNGNAPTVTAARSVPKTSHPLSDRIMQQFAIQAQQIETAVQKRLAESGDMGDVWRALTERALYSVNFSQVHLGKVDLADLDIPEEGIKKARGNAPVKRGKEPRT